MHPRELRTWQFWWRLRYKAVGLVLLLGGLITTVVLATSAASTSPPDTAQSALFVIVSAIFNTGGVWLFSHRPGAATLAASRLALRHLSEAGEAVVAARVESEQAFDSFDADLGRTFTGHISVRLSDIEQRVGSNIQDWLEAYPDLSSPTQSEPPPASSPKEAE